MTPSRSAVATEITPDDAALRKERRSKVLAGMEEEGFDILVVGREGNARYISGAPRLWTAGSRAFGPGCVVVRATGAVHLLSTWDEGVPDDIPHENLYGISFNRDNFVTAVRKVEGAETARTVATDGLTLGGSKLLPRIFPQAELVDGEPMLRRVRRVKSPDEAAAIRTAIAVAEQAFSSAEGELVAGVTERWLTGVFMEAMAVAGITTPSTQDVAWTTSSDEAWERRGRDVALEPGTLVHFDAGVLVDGYLGEFGRTRVVGAESAVHQDLRTRCQDLRDRLLAACVPGASFADLLAAYASTGVPLPPMPIARGLGLGYDLPLVTGDLPHEAAAQRVEEGMVLALAAAIWQEGVGAFIVNEPVAITASGPEVLTSVSLA
jgi:Xaa-Pro dipeptidase